MNFLKGHTDAAVAHGFAAVIPRDEPQLPKRSPAEARALIEVELELICPPDTSIGLALSTPV